MTRYLLFTSALILAACQASAGGDKNLPADTASILRGGELYADLCASCHGDDNDGGTAPTLFDDAWTYGGSETDIFKSIFNGIEDVGMPSFGETLSPKEQAELLSFIRSGGENLSDTPAVDSVASVTDMVKVETWVEGLEQPWALDFIPGTQGDMLITEKEGRLLRFAEGNVQEISGIPKVLAMSQGGLFDVAFDPEYVDDGWVYLAFAHPKAPGAKEAMTKIVRGQIDGTQWTNEETLFQAKSEHYVEARVHYGGRITFDKRGYLFFSIGDRGQKEQAQDVTRPNGKIHRIHRDGSIPNDNPFLSIGDAYPSVFAFGNRNPQGLIIHPETDVLWETEHGPKGGDELNAIKAGVNYGWPVISYGRNYNGTELTPYTTKPGMAQPESQWTPSIAVCGLDVYTGSMFPNWSGRLLVGSLRHETVRLVTVKDDKYVSEVTLLQGKGRVRDITTGPDGAIYAALPKTIVRVTPK